MTVHLLNSAMMPNLSGTYESKEIDAPLFASQVKLHMDAGNLVSYIGYPETAELLSELCDRKIEVSRAQTHIEDGDILLIAKLKHRVVNPRDKGKLKPTIDDFEFARANYTRGEWRNVDDPRNTQMGRNMA